MRITFTYSRLPWLCMVVLVASINSIKCQGASSATSTTLGDTDNLPNITSFASEINSSHYGKHFVFGFSEQYSASQSIGSLLVSVFAIFDANITLTTRMVNISTIYSFVHRNESKTLKLPNDLRMSGTRKENKGIEVNSTGYISVVCLNYIDSTSDAFRPLPTNVLGTRYVVASYKPAEKSTFGIISWNSYTTVRIKLNSSRTINQSPQFLTKILGRLQTFHISHKYDLSGTIIEASQPIAVISGDTCASVMFGNCDMLTTFLLPVKIWGKRFVVGTIGEPDKVNGDIFRVFAYENETTVRQLHGGESAILSSGQFTEIDVNKSANLGSAIQCSKPCQVIQYIKGQKTTTPNEYVDSSMVMVPSISHFSSHYVAVFPNAEKYDSTVLLLIKKQEKDGLVVDGRFSNVQWRVIEGTEFVWAIIKMYTNVSFHVVYHTSYGVTFGLLVFGGKNIRSYGYPGGFAFSSPKAYCPNETVSTVHGVFVWPKTQVGMLANVSCPRNAQAFAIRLCEGSVFTGKSWGTISAQNCPLLNKTSREIFEISQKPINSTNVVSIGQQIKNLSSAGDNLISDDVSNIASTLENIIRVGDKVNEVTDSIFNTVDNILDARLEVFRKSQQKTKSSTRIIQLVDNLLEKLNVTQNGFQKKLKNFELDLTLVDPYYFRGATFPKQDSEEIPLKRIASSPQEISIHLPETLFSENIQMNFSLTQSLIFTLYKKPKLFAEKLPESSLQRLNSYVISANVKSQSIANLKNPVVISYKVLQHGNKSSTVCVFWSTSRGEWSNEGCSFNGIDKHGMIICHCNHLTNFAMLMDVNTDNQIKTRHVKILGIISYVGCALSLLGLMLTVITISVFKDLRCKVPAQILLNFCIALSLTLIVFLTAAERSRTASMIGCRVAAIALHYFMLVVFMWTAIQAFNMYQMFVKVRNSCPKNFMKKCFCIAWGVPVLVVAITLAVAFEKYGDQKYCRLHGPSFFIAFLCPVMIILVGNCIAFVAIFHSLLSQASKTSTDRKTSGLQQARQGVAIVTLLGLTWLFGVLAVEDAKDIFQYLFCIFNSLQGLFVFIFYCLLSAATRNRYQQLFNKKASRKDLKDSRVTSDEEIDSLSQTRSQKRNPLQTSTTPREPLVVFNQLSTVAATAPQKITVNPGYAVNLVLHQKDGIYQVKPSPESEQK